jgi:hypothetical protein
MLCEALNSLNTCKYNSADSNLALKFGLEVALLVVVTRFRLVNAIMYLQILCGTVLVYRKMKTR